MARVEDSPEPPLTPEALAGVMEQGVGPIDPVFPSQMIGEHVVPPDGGDRLCVAPSVNPKRPFARPPEYDPDVAVSLPREAPDYAAHVDIHNKPGYDPCELLVDRFAWPPMSVCQDTRRVRGSHGRLGPDRQAAWTGTLPLERPPATLIDLAAAVRDWLERD